MAQKRHNQLQPGDWVYDATEAHVLTATQGWRRVSTDPMDNGNGTLRVFFSDGGAADRPPSAKWETAAAPPAPPRRRTR